MSVTELYRIRAGISINSSGQNEFVYTIVTWMVIIKETKKNPGTGGIFRTCPDRPWDPLSILYNGYRVFPGVKCGRSVLLTTHPLLVPLSWKSKAITLPTLWATPDL
jgi:hypothetical protein